MTVEILCKVASVVAVEDEVDRPRMLLLKRSTGDLKDEWCHISANIKHSETAWQTALRGLKEETGLIPRRFYSADYCEQFYEHQRNVVEIIPAFVAFVDPGGVPRLNAEHSEYRWVSFSEAASLVVFGGMRRLYEEVEREFVLRHPFQMALDFGRLTSALWRHDDRFVRPEADLTSRPGRVPCR